MSMFVLLSDNDPGDEDDVMNYFCSLNPRDTDYIMKLFLSNYDKTPFISEVTLKSEEKYTFLFFTYKKGRDKDCDVLVPQVARERVLNYHVKKTVLLE